MDVLPTAYDSPFAQALITELQRDFTRVFGGPDRTPVDLGEFTPPDGLFLVGQKPAKRKKFTKLPDLTGKRCVVFCTYAIDPGKTLDKFTKVLEARGADVLGGLAIKRNDLADGAVDFVDRVMAVAAV